jgi:hypothetical protein
MKESIVQTVKFDAKLDKSFLWQNYLWSHPVADFDSNPEQSSQILTFVLQSCHTVGTTVTIDSFLFGRAPFSIDSAYEIKIFRDLWKHTDYTEIDSIYDIPTDRKFDNVIAVGSHSFKYMTVTQYVDIIEYLLRLTKSGGHLIVCLPKLHFQFHRLKYQPHDILTQVNQQISGEIIGSLDTPQNFYLDIKNE